mmetsp:Transcript_39098/g.110627  ORF Transcript_39098/g.110627 Transcript_39098/m.110627 type:complete len:287 (-) Transcript_39098:107-967(-)
MAAVADAPQSAAPCARPASAQTSAGTRPRSMFARELRHGCPVLVRPPVEVEAGSPAARCGTGRFQGTPAYCWQPTVEPTSIGRARQPDSAPLRLTVRLLPAARMEHRDWPESAAVDVDAEATAADVRDKLAQMGLDWGPLAGRCWGEIDELGRQSGNVGIERSRLLHLGMTLKWDVSLKEQGVVDGSELKLHRPCCRSWRAAQFPTHAPQVRPATAPVARPHPRALGTTALRFGRYDEAKKLRDEGEVARREQRRFDQQRGGALSRPFRTAGVVRRLPSDAAAATT